MGWHGENDGKVVQRDKNAWRVNSNHAASDRAKIKNFDRLVDGQRAAQPRTPSLRFPRRISFVFAFLTALCWFSFAPAASGQEPSEEIEISVADDAARGRRGLANRDDAVNLFEVTYAEGFTPLDADVLRLYQAFFRREPELGGTQFWLEERARGRTISSIADFFATSDEFIETYGAIDEGAFIDLVYHNVLGRSPDESGRSFWVGQMSGPNPVSRGQVMLRFSDSVEFDAKHPYPRPIEPGGPDPLLPTVPAGEHTLDLTAYGVPADRTGDPATNNANFQRAIDDAAASGIGTIRVPAGHYLIGAPGNSIYRAGLQLPGGTAFVLDPNATIEMAPHDKWNACTLAVTNKRDVVIRGGTLIGDRDGHLFTPRTGGGTAHDEGHSICIQATSARVLVEDITIRDSTGDGILMVGNRNGSVTDITVRNSEFNNNRRQGISIVGAIRVDIHDNEIHHTNGTSPQFGIDVESLSYTSRDLKIRNNHFHHNAGGDIVNTDGRNVLIEYNRFVEGDGLSADGSRPMRNLDGPLVTWPNADQVIRHNTFHVRNGSVNGKVGIIGYAGRSGRTRNPAPVVIQDNWCDGCGMYWYQTRQVEVSGNTMLDGYLVMRDVSRAKITDNHVTHSSRCWAYRFLRVTGEASGNTYAPNFGGDRVRQDVGLQKWVPWDGCWIN